MNGARLSRDVLHEIVDGGKVTRIHSNAIAPRIFNVVVDVENNEIDESVVVHFDKYPFPNLRDYEAKSVFHRARIRATGSRRRIIS